MTRHDTTLLLVLALCAAGARNASAQAEPRFEVGGQLATLNLSDSDGQTNVGFGGRLSYDVLRWIAFEGEVSLFTNDVLEYRGAAPVSADYTLSYDRRRVEGFWSMTYHSLSGAARPKTQTS